jgi:hypothetical protein
MKLTVQDIVLLSLNPKAEEDKTRVITEVLARYADPKRKWYNTNYLLLGLREHFRLTGMYPVRDAMVAWLYHAFEPGNEEAGSVAVLAHSRRLGIGLEDAEKYICPLITGSHPSLESSSVVGDMRLCQPSGTRVTILDTPLKHLGKTGSQAAAYREHPIESLPENGVISWRRSQQRTYAAPRKVRVASRWYEGPLLRIEASNGSSTRITPEHWVWVRFSKNTKGKYALYLMHHKEYGYRIGTTKFKSGHTNESGYDLSSRMSKEGADGGWILRVFDSRLEAEAWEEIYSLKYGVPECIFKAQPGTDNRKTQRFIELVFSYASPDGALRCLKEHGMSDNDPLIDSEILKKKKCRGYFKTAAANIVPLVGLLDIPIQGINKYTLVKGVTIEQYKGLVHSLDVEKDHTYIADGLVVGNCILGQKRIHYLSYARKVKMMWRASGIRDEAWRLGRIAILNALLGRKRLYLRDEFESSFAQAAHNNMQAELDLLGYTPPLPPPPEPTPVPANRIIILNPGQLPMKLSDIIKSTEDKQKEVEGEKTNEVSSPGPGSPPPPNEPRTPGPLPSDCGEE